MSDRSIPTPRESGTLQRGPVFAALMRGLAAELEAMRVRCVGHGPEGLRELDIQLAMKCRKLADKARDLEISFALWEATDPGPEERLKLVAQRLDLEAEAKELLPKKKPLDP